MEVEAPPIKLGDPVLLDVFLSGRVEPGALDHRQVDIIASFMAGRVPPQRPLPLGPGLGAGGGLGMNGHMDGSGGNPRAGPF